ncbi:hypothetical protein [Psychromicrobium sp. YIM B11713]|uniref:hypothetical protein n=1 Tax=Psychromicrobium sp. YIM B11713 TaxID=3145233 RepID=UPI00374E513D
MRGRVNWLELGLQIGGFVLIYLLLSLVSWPFLVKLLAALVLAMVFGVVANRIRRQVRRRRSEPRRIRVISVETVDD